jgi:two-component system response regulator AlgR
MTLSQTLRVLLVDDEPLARARLRTLLGDCPPPQPLVLGEAGDAVAAMDWLSRNACDVVLLDIHMPGADGMQLAQAIQALPQPPAVVFVTAHAEHAVQAFELDAVDYLTKPVRLERLLMALKKAEQRMSTNKAVEPEKASNFVLIHDRGRTERVPLADIVYLRAELKYVTVRTREAHAHLRRLAGRV